jgi:leader peptidase (prepilin peptidase)/N-methyltransferase
VILSHLHPAMSLFIAGILFFLGTIIASFTTVIAERVYTGQSWAKGRSRCNSCRRQLSMIDLVPVFSLIAFRARCRTCKARIPMLYSVFEAALGITFACAYFSLGQFLVSLVVFLLACTLLLFIVVYDLRHMVVTWRSSLAFVGLSLVFAVLQMVAHHEALPSFLLSIGIALGIGLFFFSMYFFSRGRWMGLGDTPIAIGLSILVGSAAIPGLLFSFWVGAVIGIALLFLQRGRTTMKSEIPFVPFLALGYLLAFFTQWNPFL